MHRILLGDYILEIIALTFIVEGDTRKVCKSNSNIIFEKTNIFLI